MIQNTVYGNDYKTMDVTQTAGYKEAMDDIAHNRITHHNSVDDMFKNILGESALQKIRINHV